jgi:2-polyprenyl-6-hydroxyphenyl methylase/3-demethylubiquinone-9 3-methyltransferase
MNHPKTQDGDASGASEFKQEISAGKRFEFGKNWKDFLRFLTPERIAEAQKSLAAMLGRESLAGKTFLDIGCGSGLFSLAARKMGASVRSFDYDPDSVACCQKLKETFFPGDNEWSVESGSVLDKAFLEGLGRFDVVYSWGVLHHTGSMWEAIENAAARVKPEGLFYIAIYNDQGWKSSVWTALKKTYNRLPPSLRWVFADTLFVLAYGGFIFKYTILLKPWIPLSDIWNYRKRRGMKVRQDWKDWIGGYPFEVATPAAIGSFLGSRGFRMDRVKRVKSLGCNEFLLTRLADAG